ncbi:hypothetical protein CXB51_029883 [Gossypium anomalum]|uniref:Endonuclease/exonuclease/phosphatase domain-containing protein n=1 Tax=Gossypium anomalum TaxID=47600 RepID=A0A8J6CR29_9ROSI|nr:hypothetical protein CXB51_029883 [Gossypium anomalum]
MGLSESLDDTERKSRKRERREKAVANASLSNLDINNRRKLILGEAKKTWDVGKKAFGSVVTIWDRGSFQVDKDLCEERFIVVGKWLPKGIEVVLINVYAPNTISEQKILWVNLLALKNSFACSWIIGGSFNVVRNKSERSNCVGLMNASKEFNSFIDNYKMVDLPLMGKKFTWYGPNMNESVEADLHAAGMKQVQLEVGHTSP